jgi:uncharacterized protein involved in cysteine biosynthesis
MMNRGGNEMPPWVRDLATQWMTPGFNLSRTLITLLILVVVYSLFSMVGGIIGVAVLNRKSTA